MRPRNRLLTFALEAPKLTLLLVAAVTAVAAFYARSVEIDGSMETLLAQGDPERTYYEEAKKTFGSEEVTIVGVFAEDVFQPATLDKIDRLSREIGDIEGVKQVVSLTTVQNVTSDDEGLHVGKLIREIPRTPEAVQQLRDRTLANRLYIRAVVSADGKAAALTVVFEPMTEQEFETRQLDDRIRAIVAGAGGPERLAVTGLPTMKVHGALAMERDIALFTPLALVVVFAVLFWAFRTVRGVLVPLGTVTVGLLWTVGLMVVAGSPISMGTMVLPPLVMTIGIAYSIHIVSQYYEEVRPGRSPAEVVAASMLQVGIPVAVCALATIIGFAPFAFSSIRAIWDFGVYSIFGVIAVLIASFTLTPAALALLPLPRRQARHRGEHDWLTRLLERLGTWAMLRRRLVFLATALVCVVCGLGIRRIEVMTDYLSFFSPESSVRRDSVLVSEKLAGTQPIYVAVDGDAPGSVTKLKTIAAMKELQAFLLEQPGVDTAMSQVDYLGLLRHALDAGEADSLPTSQEEVDQLFLFANPDDLEPLLNNDRSRANILLRTKLSSSTDLNRFVERVKEFGAAHLPRGVTAHPTGSVVLLNRSADALAWGQITGLWQVVLVLFAVLSIMFLSLRVGLLALIPNLVPIVVLFGVMGWSGISLSISTSLIASLALGLAIDDTIHFFSSFHAEVHRSGAQEEAVLQTMRFVGRPMVFTATALTAGFLIVCLSTFQPVRYFGYLSGLTIAIGLVVELFLSPALVTATKIITLWDLLALKLGPEPHQQIPLFTGLRPFQAKIVVLMAQLATAPTGTLLTRRGEVREELYVILRGRAEVYHSYGGIPIQEFGRGDVVGEMGLVRGATRSADVIVREDAEYLALDARFLKRLERRYPRIAAIVLLNLARILSDRLESTTEALGDSRN